MLSNSQFRNTLSDFFRSPDFSDSSIRPASIDLSVGKIVVPPDEEWHAPSIVSQYVVPVGGTLVIETHEFLNIPATHAALMFPKSSALAEKGILITNFGCVDPGYQGHLKFVILNLGRKAFAIRSGDKVVTLTLFSLGIAASPEYQEFTRGRPPGIGLDATAKLLARDFVEVTKRASDEARKTVKEGIVGIGVILSLFLIVPTIIIAISPLLLDVWQERDSERKELRDKVTAISEQQADMLEMIESMGPRAQGVAE